MRILHLDDDPLQLEIARNWLEGEGHAVSGVSRGQDAIDAIRQGGFDIAVLDWMVPDISGEEVLRWIREHDRRIPVMFATSAEDEAQIVRILEMGADDYLVKPLRRGEFIARVRALARRAGLLEEPAEDLAPYRLDREARAVLLRGEPVRMSTRMTDLAFFLFGKRGEIVSRKEIYRRVWGARRTLESRTVDTFVSRLRTALQLDGRHGWRIVSVYQHGYRLERTS
ncbi:MAG: response regulator transcription factor [Betaproteobacteria bacterium]